MNRLSMPISSTIVPIFLACLLGEFAHGESVSPDDPRIAYRGVAYPQVTAQRAELLRFSPQLLAEAKPNTHGFNPEKARCTTGASIAFSTDSPTVTLNFQAERKMPFGIYQNGQFVKSEDSDKDGTLVVESIHGGKSVHYRIAFPTFHNPIFTGLTLEAGHDLRAPAPAPKRVFVALGDSITHGRGQDTSHQTWGWQVAEELQMDFYNVAVGGSNANASQSIAIAALPKVDLVSILWGYNDWVNRGKSVDEFSSDMNDAIDVIRAKHPDTRIAVMRMLQTKTTASKKTGEQFSADEFRAAASDLVATRRKSGDTNIHCIASETMTNREEDLRDPVHLSLTGATKLAKAMAAQLKPLTQ